MRRKVHHHFSKTNLTTLPVYLLVPTNVWDPVTRCPVLTNAIHPTHSAKPNARKKYMTGTKQPMRLLSNRVHRQWIRLGVAKCCSGTNFV